MSQLTKLYVAIPYSGIEEDSYQHANIVTADLISQGYNAFSPITHSHPLSTLLGFEPTWNYWQYIDYQFLDWADQMIVVVLPENGKNLIINSTGVQAEINYALKHYKPIKFYIYETGQIVDQLDTKVESKAIV